MPGLIKYGRRILVGLVLLFVLPSSLWAAVKDLDIRPEAVTISSFFSGVQMHITCDIPPGSQAVLSVRGKKIEEELMRKSHQWELWMNRGEVDIDNAPMLYIALSSESRLLSKGGGDFPWGYEALEKKAGFSGSLKPSEDETIFQEFIQLKERDNLYHLYPGGLKITQISPDRWQASARFHLPSRLKPGTYHVTLWIVRNGVLVDRGDDSFEVRQEGLPEFLHSLAIKHGIFYGFLAVALAMVVGMLTGLAFHSRGGGH